MSSCLSMCNNIRLSSDTEISGSWTDSDRRLKIPTYKFDPLFFLHDIVFRANPNQKCQLNLHFIIMLEKEQKDSHYFIIYKINSYKNLT